MKKLYYDLHIHSCLSPCGDNEATPDSIAGMGELNGLDIMALTDHNSTDNCPAFFKAAARHGIVPVAGAELTTAEDIHVVCLFEELEAAADFAPFLKKHRILVKNREDIFGEQLIMNEFDEVLGREENLLINATDISIGEVRRVLSEFGAIAYPAHIDRESGGIIAVLGTFPAEYGFTAAELSSEERLAEYSALTGLSPESFVFDSDAHVLWSISEKSSAFELDCGDSPEEIRAALFEFLRRKK